MKPHHKTRKWAIVSTFLISAFCLLPFALSRSLLAQAPPATEIFLAPLTISSAAVKVGAPTNISNNAGYDNQPSFLPDSSGVLFASNRYGKQNDIYRWDVIKKQLVQLTHTDENEYSPLVSPDGKSFVTVHGAEQSLFRYNLDGSNPRLAYQHGKELIGYHVWISDTEIAAFVLGATGQPNTLQLIDITTGKSQTIASAIGRSLLKRPGTSTISYVAMGWLVVVAIKPVLQHLDNWTLGWLFAGGLFYTGGTWFYMHQKLKYAHAIWHVFVLLGSLSHYIAVMSLILPR